MIKGRLKGMIQIDPEKFYKNQQHLMLDLNEAKLQSPIVYVDPTFKERNALAALSEECFEKLKKRALEFLKNPSSRFFENKDLEEALKKRYKSLKIIETRTEKQKGDIAGSKLKKFYEFLAFNLLKDFELIFKEFEYNEDENTGKNYFVLKQKKEIIINGPPITSKENLNKFKEKHKNLFIKQGKAYAKEKSRNLNELIDSLKKDKSMKEMGITEIK